MGSTPTHADVWLIRLGIRMSHSRPYHPQTQGKDERFHRTLNAELLAHQSFSDQAAAQRHFDAWRSVYNLERQHQALGMNPPISRYRPSARPFPELLPAIEYAPEDACARSRQRANSIFEAVPGRSARPFMVTQWLYAPPRKTASWRSTSVTIALLPSTSMSHNDLNNRYPCSRTRYHVSGPYNMDRGGSLRERGY